MSIFQTSVAQLDAHTGHYIVVSLEKILNIDFVRCGKYVQVNIPQRYIPVKKKLKNKWI